MVTGEQSREGYDVILLKPSGTCRRCKNKKLKCDRNPQSCFNCRRSDETCLHVDPISGRQYTRDYADKLRDRISHLKASIREASLQSQISGKPQENGRGSPLNTDHTSSKITRLGSVSNLGQLVAAAVAAQMSDKAALRVALSMAREQNVFDRSSATPAELPPRPEAEQLLVS